MKFIALLPLKANSVRVPGKNFRLFNGKPLYHWILSELLLIPEIEKVVINSDARNLLVDTGVDSFERTEIRDRSQAVCGDEVSMNLVIKDDLDNIAGEHFVMTHTTNPLLTAGTIRSGLEKYHQALESGQADSVFSANRVQTRFYGLDGSPINHDPGNLIPTQNLEPWFEENSGFYVFSRTSFDATKARIGRRPTIYVTPKEESADIDTEDDWKFAELLSEIKASRGAVDVV